MQIYEQHICYVLTYGERDDMHYAMRQVSLIVVVDFIGLVWSCLISMAMKRDGECCSAFNTPAEVVAQYLFVLGKAPK